MRPIASLNFPISLLLAAGLSLATQLCPAQQDLPDQQVQPDRQAQPDQQAQSDRQAPDIASAATAQAGIITTLAGGGPSKEGYSGDGGPAAAAKVGFPYGVWVDKSGNVYFSDQSTNSIRMVNATTGVITRIAGRGACDTSGTFDCGDGGPALNADLYSPWNGTFDAEGNLYIADFANSEVRRIDHATKVITAVAGYACPEQNSIGCHELLGFSGDGGQSTSALLDFPTAVAFDSEGNLYIADNYNRAIRKVTIKTGIIETVVGRGAGCAHQTDALGDGCPAKQAMLLPPNGLAFDKEGNLFISDSSLVRRVDAKTGIVTTYAGSLNYMNQCPGQQDNYGDGCPANAISMLPDGIAFDPEGNLYVMDTLAPHGGYVRRIDSKTGLLSRVAGGGSCTTKTYFYYCGDGKQATAAELNQPTSIAFDNKGNLYIADFHNSAVRKVTFDTAKFAQTPQFTPPPGLYHETQQVRLEDSTAHAVIHYTIDGSTPTASSREYGGPIALTDTTTLRAIAVAPGLGSSTVNTGIYTIQGPPAVTTKPASEISSQIVTLNATVNDNDQTARLWFVYGASKSALTKTTLQHSLLAKTTAQSAGILVEGLQSKTTYYFKAMASTAAGTTSGSILSFTTK